MLSVPNPRKHIKMPKRPQSTHNYRYNYIMDYIEEINSYLPLLMISELSLLRYSTNYMKRRQWLEIMEILTDALITYDYDLHKGSFVNDTTPDDVIDADFRRGLMYHMWTKLRASSTPDLAEIIEELVDLLDSEYTIYARHTR